VDAAKDTNGDGYTNIETYINNIDPMSNIDWTDPNFNFDTLAEIEGSLAEQWQ
jgi:hypothetical protein